MPHPLARAALAALALLPCVPRPGATQVIELTPFLALHAPTGTFPYPVDPEVFGTVRAEHETALGFGLGARTWLDRSHGVQASLTRIGSGLSFGASAHLTTFTAAALLRLPVRSLANPVWATLGAAIVARGGRGYEGVEGTTSVGGVLGIGTALPAHEDFDVELGLDFVVYPSSLERADQAPGTSTQFDLRARAGVAFTLAGGPPAE